MSLNSTILSRNSSHRSTRFSKAANRFLLLNGVILFMVLTSCASTMPKINSKFLIKTTTDFVTYFTVSEDLKNYFKLKDNIEAAAKDIKYNVAISADNKTQLKTYYTVVDEKSKALYNQLEADLLSTPKRREIAANIPAYVANFNLRLKEINTAHEDFKNQYQAITGQTKSSIVPALLNIFLPIAKEFANEAINTMVKAKLETDLKPKLVLKNWDTI